MTTLFLVVLFFVVTLAWTFWAVRRASPGYEDSSGFHYGERELSKSSTRLRLKRPRPPKQV
jgi:hypothetical protein